MANAYPIPKQWLGAPGRSRGWPRNQRTSCHGLARSPAKTVAASSAKREVSLDNADALIDGPKFFPFV